MTSRTPPVPPTAIPIPEVFLGRRVLVRPYELSDAAAVHDAVRESREVLRPWMPWAADKHQTLEQSIDFCARSRANWLLRDNMNLGIFSREDGRYLGGTGFHRPDWETRAFEIGYWCRASETGKGYIAESTRVLTRAAYEHLAAQRVEIRCDARNERSRRVAERCGFVLEGTRRRSATAVDGALRDTLVFALIREEIEALLPRWHPFFPAQ